MRVSLYPLITMIGLCCALEVPVHGASWRFWEKPAKKVHDAPRLRIGVFNGPTGASAEKALRRELISAGELLPVAMVETAGHSLSGSSSGGRVTARLSDEKSKTIFERTYAAPGLDENVKALADDLIYAVTGKPGLATSQIAFVSDATGRKQIYICDSDGGNVQQVTRDPFGAVSPSVSTDASLLVYTTYRSGFPCVQLLDLGGGHERLLSDSPGGGSGASISPDGQRVALTLGFVGTPEVFVTELNNGNSICLSETTGVPCAPAWHPKDPIVMFSCDEGRGPTLWIGTLKKDQRAKPWPTKQSFCTDPEWSPDGRQVAFTAKSGGAYCVVVQDYPEGKSRVIQRSGAQHPTWSPNGRFIAYVQGGELWLHDLRTQEQRMLVKNLGTISEPRWMR